MILCNTNIFVEIYRGNETMLNILQAIGFQNIALSDITYCELLYGARNNNEKHLIIKDLSQFERFPVNISISDKSTHLIEQFTLSHHLSLPDAMIAATALCNDIELFTLNIKDFKFIPTLKFFNLPTLPNQTITNPNIINP